MFHFAIDRLAFFISSFTVRAIVGFLARCNFYMILLFRRRTNFQTSNELENVGKRSYENVRVEYSGTQNSMTVVNATTVQYFTIIPIRKAISNANDSK